MKKHGHIASVIKSLRKNFEKFIKNKMILFKQMSQIIFISGSSFSKTFDIPESSDILTSFNSDPFIPQQKSSQKRLTIQKNLIY